MFKVIVTYKDGMRMSVDQYHLKHALAYKERLKDPDTVRVQIFPKYCAPDLTILDNKFGA